MSTRVLLATSNAKKLAELRRIMAGTGLNVELLSRDDVAAYPEPVESEWTFEGNALIKARAGCAASGLPTLADDSGLCVDALNQMPGVRSSRWAGPGHDDVANLELLLAQIDDVVPARRTAKFVAVMALVVPDGREFHVRGEMPGWITTKPTGDGGFGYDPIFVPVDSQRLGPSTGGGEQQLGDVSSAVVGNQGRTSAQLSPAEKDAISHRGKAIRAMIPLLASALKEVS